MTASMKIFNNITLEVNTVVQENHLTADVNNQIVSMRGLFLFYLGESDSIVTSDHEA